MAVCLEILAVLISIVIGIITYFKWSFSYWKRKGVPYIEPSIPFGTFGNPREHGEYIGTRLARQYREFKSKGHKHGGLYKVARPTYFPVDLEYVKNVMSKDFDHFTDHGSYYNERDDPISANLFNLEGQQWKNLRAKLTPTFTSGKIKGLFQTLTVCGEQTAETVEGFRAKNLPVNIKEVLACFTTDVIGSCAFGIDCNSFKDPNSRFRKYGREVFEVPSTWKALQLLIGFVNVKLARFLRITTVKEDIRKFFMEVVKECVSYREKTKLIRKDFLQSLIDLKNDNATLTLNELCAQAFVFFVAGFETSSNTMAFCMYELASNPAMQRRVREEIQNVLSNHNGEMTYDAVMDMTYLGQIIDETLRKYPPVAKLPRICVEDYRVPGTDVTIEKGTRIAIPIHPLHHDPEFFPDPDKFDPERFSEKNKKNIRPFSYMPFGEGPRMCIALRFGLIQTKVGLASLLKNFRFSVNPKTIDPLILTMYNFVLTTKGGIWLNVEKI